MTLNSLFTTVTPEITRILNRALADQGLNEAEAEALFHAKGLHLLAVMGAVDELRRRLVGERVTFAKVRNINFTNVCYTACKFCEFGWDRNDPEAYTFLIEECIEQAQEAWDLGCSEICMQGGLNPILGGDIYIRLVQAIKAALPDLHIHAFSHLKFNIQARCAASHLNIF